MTTFSKMTQNTTLKLSTNTPDSQFAIHWEYDLDKHQYVYIDKAVVNLFGFSVDQWKSKQFRKKHIHEDDRDWVMSIPGNEKEFSKEYRIVSNDGEAVWVRDNITVVRFPGLPTKLHGYMTDITDQKVVESAMQMLAQGSPDDVDNAFFHQCLENVASVYDAKYAFIGILNEDKKSVKTLSVWANGKLADNFEYDLEHTPCQDVLRLTKELIPTGVTELYPKDELLIQMGVDSYFGTPLTPSNQEMTGLLAILDDKPMQLTSWTAPVLSLFASRIAVELKKREQHLALKEMMEKAQAANRAKTEFLANMSHELRTPMHAILGFSSHGLNKTDNAPRHKLNEYFNHINTSATSLMSLLNDLLDLSKLEAGKMIVEKKQCTIHNLISACIEEQRLQIEEKNINIDYESNNPDTLVHCDPSKLSQVINNLLSNAIKFSPKSSKIIIRVEDQENSSCLSISDEGPGIPENELATIFDKFVQSSRTNTGAGGTGLGLAICKEIIDAHNGTIWAKNKSPIGTTFLVRIPYN